MRLLESSRAGRHTTAALFSVLLGGVLASACGVETDGRLTDLGVVSATQQSVERGIAFDACSLGFWKHNATAGVWGPTGAFPDDQVDTVFTHAPGALGLLTLAEALDGDGGRGVEGAGRLLLRAGIVAWLNAAHPEVNAALTPEQVEDLVNDAFDTNDRRAILEAFRELSAVNAGPCPEDPNADGLPDLVVSALSINDIIDVGGGTGRVFYSFTVTNIGTAPAYLTGMVVQAYDSADDQPGGDVAAGGLVPFPPPTDVFLQPGASFSRSFNGLVTIGHYLLVRVDSQDVVVELDETNNFNALFVPSPT